MGKVTLDICDIPFFRRLAVLRIQPYTRTYYEMNNGLFTLDITQARLFTQGNVKHYKNLTERGYRVADKEFKEYDLAIEYSMLMLILTYGFEGFLTDNKSKGVNKYGNSKVRKI